MAIYSKYGGYNININVEDLIDRGINESRANIKVKKSVYSINIDDGKVNGQHGYRGKLITGSGRSAETGVSIAMSRDGSNRVLIPDKCMFPSNYSTAERNEKFDIIGGFMLYAYDAVAACSNRDPNARIILKQYEDNFNSMSKVEKEKWIDIAKSMRQGYKL